MDALHTALLARGFSPEDIQFPTSANDVRVVNLLVPVIPRVMVKPRSVQLVSAALKAAKEFDLKVQARSGGHSYGSYCLGGVDGHLVVDLLHFKEFHMDQTSWRATVGPAIILKDLCNLLHDSGGRAIPHGIRPTVGIGGHATTGGMVTANGDILTTSREVNPDLFWAIRGAAASFGIVTQFVFKTHSEPKNFLTFSYSFGLDPDIFKIWQRFVSQPHLDPNLSTSFSVVLGASNVSGTYSGSEEEFLGLRFEEAFNDHERTKRSLEVTSWKQHVVDYASEEKAKGTPKALMKVRRSEPSVFSSKSIVIKENHPLSDEIIDGLFNYARENEPGEMWGFLAELQNGGSNSVPADSTSFGHRDTLFILQCAYILDSDPDYPDESRISKMIKFTSGLKGVITSSMPSAAYGHYAGYVDPTVDKESYWGERYPRLVELKHIWDPENRFADPQSVGAGLD